MARESTCVLAVIPLLSALQELPLLVDVQIPRLVSWHR